MTNLHKVCLLAMVLALGISEASGQFVWIKDVHNPVLTGGAAGTWNYHVDQPCVLFNSDSARYEMWFVGYQSGRPGRIGFATSTDGMNWTMYPSPILTPDSGTWDSEGVEKQRVIREHGQYKMWYTGAANSTLVPASIGYATSPDGIHWTKYSGNPVMSPSTAPWEAGIVYSPSIMPTSGGYRMWYGACDVSVS